MATARLRKFLKNMQVGEMFAARDVLNFSRRRPTVYGALYRLNKLGEITRVAQGLYIKGSENSPKPTVSEIAHAKARAFCKTVREIGLAFARGIGIEIETKSQSIFATSGRSYTIKSCHGPIQFVGVSLRKIALQDSDTGIELRTMWHFGRRADPAPFIQNAAQWSENSRQESDPRFKLLPYWLSSMLPLVNTGRSPILVE